MQLRLLNPGDAVPSLTAAAGPDAGTTFTLTDPVLIVGRHSAARVRLSDERVSRRHLELRQSGTGYRLIDLGSGNGTRVNGDAVQVAELRAGDRIEVGGTVLVYDADPADATTAAGPTVLVRVIPPDASRIVRSVPAEAASELLRVPPDGNPDWLRGRLACLAALYAAAEATAQILDIHELLGQLIDLAVRTTRADHGVALLIDPATAELSPAATRCREGHLTRETVVVSRTIVDLVLTDHRAVLVADAANDDRFAGQASVARHALREVICAPMTGRHGTVGVLFLDTAGAGHTSFTDDHLSLAVALAHQAALAVEETRYYHAMMQAERLAAVGQTMAALSHHVKNIMQGVRFGSDLVRLALADNDREMLRKGWTLVERNQARIDDLILDMLSYSKQREPEFLPTNLNIVAADVVELTTGRATAAGVTLTFTPSDLPLVDCDPDGLHRALLNVVTNAIDAIDASDSDAARLVTVHTCLADEWAEIAVIDTGPGIDPATTDELFKPFVSSKGNRGTGLGLPVSRKILQEHGGDLTAAPRREGGSVFTLRIPLIRHDSEPT